MKILVLNCGSSSVKYKLIDTATNDVMAEGGVEKIGLPDGFLKYKLDDGSKAIRELGMVDHKGAVKAVLDILTDPELGCIKSYNEIDAVGHRVVHGAEKFSKSVLITDEVLQQVKDCYDLAPLHNPANVTGIEAVEEILPGIKQVGVFDTAFHQTMPAKSYMYALPYRFYKEDGVRRYGFHGTSHSYVSKKAAEVLGKKYEDLKIIVCHMGNGASLSAVKNGKCVDTSMGLTPLEGVIMGTRSGDIDPAFVEYLCNKENLTVSEVLNILNKKSGMLGMTGISSDYRDVSAAAEAGNQDAIHCLEAYAYRIIKYIGSYIAAMGGVDVITFTAGLGENAIPLRETICKAFEFMGLEFDSEANNCRGVEKIITKEGSKITACVIPTNEEIAICEETVELVKGK